MKACISAIQRLPTTHARTVFGNSRTAVIAQIVFKSGVTHEDRFSQLQEGVARVERVDKQKGSERHLPFALDIPAEGTAAEERWASAIDAEYKACEELERATPEDFDFRFKK